MSVCNYTQLVTPNTCLGDSLATFNSNFSALDEALCRQPDMIGGPGIHAQLNVSEQMHSVVEFSTKNSIVFGASFDLGSLATKENIAFSDGSVISTTSIPYRSTDSVSPALATFTSTSVTRNPPCVSIFWTASGTNNSTVYFTNSATSSISDMGSMELNGSVTSFLSSGRFVYVGGEFTKVGDSPCRKLVILDLQGGTPHPTYPNSQGSAGTVVGTELSAGGGFGTIGAINSILEWGDLIIFGGTYQSLLMGRGLTIYSKTTGIIYPFYVNGEVNCLAINNNELYVGGTFDYINYTAQSASTISGLRRYTNGLAKVLLQSVESFPNSSISTVFGKNVGKTFKNLTTINSIAAKSGFVYIGGSFNGYNDSTLVAANLAIINGDGTINTSWSPVIDGEVFTLAVNGDYLYAGGIIKGFYTTSQFFAAPRKLDVAYNAVCFNVNEPGAPIYQYNWKPKFNGPISKFAFHDESLSTWVYCYGNFTQVNGLDASYLAAVDKSYNNSKDGQTYILWKNDLEKPPQKINNALIRGSNFVLVGGTFQKINEANRSYIGRINGVYETISTDLLKTVVWDFGAQLCNPGSNLKLNTTNFVTVSSYPGTYGTVNQTTIPIEYTSSIFKNYSEGSLMRFFVRRSSSKDTLTSSAHIIGWKLDFN